MTTPATPSSSKSARAAREATEAEVIQSSEEQFQSFWEKNRTTIFVLVAVVLIGLLLKGGWEYLQASKENDVEHAYAAATTPDKLKDFAAEHTGHTLSGVARLRIADEAYAAGKSAEAVSAYEEAVASLPAGPLSSRAKLGLAMSRIQAGKTAEGEAALKQLAADANESKSIRVEANYQLASLASAEGKTDDVRKYSEQVMQLDVSSPWTQRVFMLRASLPPEPAPTTATGVKLPGSGK